MIEDKLYQITASYMAAGVVVQGGVVVKTAPIVKYLRGWPEARMIAYAKQKGWTIVRIEEHGDVSVRLEKEVGPE